MRFRRRKLHSVQAGVELGVLHGEGIRQAEELKRMFLKK
jgi:hypothetical protein